MTAASVIAVLMALVLSAVALVHFYWATGGLWPARDEASLTRMVVGWRDRTRMPSRGTTVLVALLILAAGLWPLLWVGLLSLPVPRFLLAAGTAGLALVFLVRGVAGYLPAFRAVHGAEPFATLDRRYFSPLILALGAGFAILLVLQWSA